METDFPAVIRRSTRPQSLRPKDPSPSPPRGILVTLHPPGLRWECLVRAAGAGPVFVSWQVLFGGAHGLFDRCPRCVRSRVSDASVASDRHGRGLGPGRSSRRTLARRCPRRADPPGPPDPGRAGTGPGREDPSRSLFASLRGGLARHVQRRLIAVDGQGTGSVSACPSVGGLEPFRPRKCLSASHPHLRTTRLRILPWISSIPTSTLRPARPTTWP